MNNIINVNSKLSIYDLPSEIHQHIFGYLNVFDLNQCFKVSQFFTQCITVNNWMRAFEANMQVSKKLEDFLKQRYYIVKHLSQKPLGYRKSYHLVLDNSQPRIFYWINHRLYIISKNIPFSAWSTLQIASKNQESLSLPYKLIKYCKVNSSFPPKTYLLKDIQLICAEQALSLWRDSEKVFLLDQATCQDTRHLNATFLRKLASTQYCDMQANSIIWDVKDQIKIFNIESRKVKKIKLNGSIRYRCLKQGYLFVATAQMFYLYDLKQKRLKKCRHSYLNAIQQVIFTPTCLVIKFVNQNEIQIFSLTNLTYQFSYDFNFLQPLPDSQDVLLNSGELLIFRNHQISEQIDIYDVSLKSFKPCISAKANQRISYLTISANRLILNYENKEVEIWDLTKNALLTSFHLKKKIKTLQVAYHVMMIEIKRSSSKRRKLAFIDLITGKTIKQIDNFSSQVLFINGCLFTTKYPIRLKKTSKKLEIQFDLFKLYNSETKIINYGSIKL